jgi:hypothetical protein
MTVCIACEWRLRSSDDALNAHGILIERYDRMEALYLTTGDFAALQQMKTQYPTQTRWLIEDVLRLGKVDDADINIRFLKFFQDTSLQALIADVNREYGNMDDVATQLTESFERLQSLIPGIEVPSVYTQIASLDQSIVVGDSFLGISLDKYLGADYPLYLKFGYSERQRASMTRQFIVPDCLGFYLLSRYPIPADSMMYRHMGRIQHVVNCVLQQRLFDNEFVKQAEQFMEQNGHMSFDMLLKDDILPE